MNLSQLCLNDLISDDITRPFTSYDIIDVAISRVGQTLPRELLDEKITRILNRLSERNLIKKKNISLGENGESKNLILYWTEGPEPSIQNKPFRRKLCTDQNTQCFKRQHFKPFKTPLKKPSFEDDRIKNEIDLNQVNLEISTNIQKDEHLLKKLLIERKSLENRIKELTAKLKVIPLAKLYKEEEDEKLDRLIFKWNSIVLKALERLRISLGPVDLVALKEKFANVNNTSFNNQQSFETRILTMDEIASFMGLDLDTLKLDSNEV